MLITFDCKLASTVSMQERYAKQMLTLMKQSGSIPSALGAESVEQALVDLQQGLKDNKTDQDDEDKDNSSIPLNTRAYPLIQLLNHAIQNEEYIMWDYNKGIF
jgi:hypothetical protein